MPHASTANDYVARLTRELVKLPTETEWVEFKENNADPQEIAEYISALSNAATLCGKSRGYLVWGVDDSTHEIVGTEFEPKGEEGQRGARSVACSDDKPEDELSLL